MHFAKVFKPNFVKDMCKNATAPPGKSSGGLQHPFICTTHNTILYEIFQEIFISPNSEPHLIMDKTSLEDVSLPTTLLFEKNANSVMASHSRKEMGLCLSSESQGHAVG